ncbi:hypothetical protein [Streptomyces sp. NPDC101132]|uniref:hypothetical protein n=1 Tax=Streptomyces sp. NPDC101132 TaxID=3366110 RepID=UPI00382A5340
MTNSNSNSNSNSSSSAGISTPTPTLPRLARGVAAGVLTLGLTTGLAACGGSDAAPAPKPKVGSTATTPDEHPAVKPLGRAKPTGLKIPSASVNTTKMTDLSVDAKGELGVPDADTEADVPGWWTGGVTPGRRASPSWWPTTTRSTARP